MRSTVNTIRFGALASNVVGIASRIKTQQNAEPAVDMRAQEADNEAGDRHAERAGVDRKTHLGGRYVVMPGQRGKDRLGGEQIDHGQEGREADDE